MSAPEVTDLRNRLADVWESLDLVQLAVEAAVRDEADPRLRAVVRLLGDAGDELKAISAALADYEKHIDALADSAAAVAESAARIAGTAHRVRTMEAAAGHVA